MLGFSTIGLKKVLTKSIKSILSLMKNLGKLFFFNNLTNKTIHFSTNSVLKNKIWISIEIIRKHFYKRKSDRFGEFLIGKNRFGENIKMLFTWDLWISG
jgi:hypothetical protein